MDLNVNWLSSQIPLWPSLKPSSPISGLRIHGRDVRLRLPHTARTVLSLPTEEALATIWTALRGPRRWLDHVKITGSGDLPAVFAATDLATAAVGAAALAVAELISVRRGKWLEVSVDRRMASLWFGTSIQPEGWTLPPAWDAVAGDYETSDGWIRLHTNAPHHRAAALKVVGAAADRDQVATAVRGWKADALESTIVDQGGCAAAMRGKAAWAAHPQGQAIAAEPLLHHTPGQLGDVLHWDMPASRPLRGVRVLDLTRVLAGPVATRFLAGFGADVLRIDPPEWDEPATVPDVTLGKRCARLDLREEVGRQTWEGLLRTADVIVHGYRPGALARRGLGAARRAELCPALIDVSLDAYGWTGPWRGRRGFDSLVQMSSGIAEAGMHQMGHDKPTPLPVQALDHATGYMMAAAVVRGLTERLTTGRGCTVRASLARTATLLVGLRRGSQSPLAPKRPGDYASTLEATTWGPARRLRPSCSVEGAPMRWVHPAGPLGTIDPVWKS